MNDAHLKILQTFDLQNIPDLDTAVLGALELFQQTTIPTYDYSQLERPIVVGSGNAEATGRIIFEQTDAVFASESNIAEKLTAIPSIKTVVVISASGEKHAPIIVNEARQQNKKVVLITNSPESSASKLLTNDTDEVLIYPKNREPYTYNTSTYMGMIIGATKENPSDIWNFIQQSVAPIDMTHFKDYSKFYLIVPPQFAGVIRMLEVKFIELFGRNVARDIETSEYVAHATTVAPSKELFISFGQPNTTWGDSGDRLYIPLPDNAGYGCMMAVGYYVVAQIQKQQPDYFKQNIAAYTKHVSKIFGHELTPIVS